MAICKTTTLTDINMISVINLTVPTSSPIGNNITVTATVKNIGTTSFADTVTFYIETVGTVICLKGTSYLAVGATEDIDCTFNTGGWASGNYNICAKTTSEG